jgi:hypothetical protein
MRVDRRLGVKSRAIYWELRRHVNARKGVW